MDDVNLDFNLYKTQAGDMAAKTIKPKPIAIKGNPKIFALNPTLISQRKYATVNIVIPAINKRVGNVVSFSFKAG